MLENPIRYSIVMGRNFAWVRQEVVRQQKGAGHKLRQ
jgi:hypothetical protein